MNLTCTVRSNLRVLCQPQVVPTISRTHRLPIPLKIRLGNPFFLFHPKCVSKPSPHAILVGGRALKATHGDERGSVTGVRTGMGTTVEFRPQLKHKTPRGN